MPVRVGLVTELRRPRLPGAMGENPMTRSNAASFIIRLNTLMTTTTLALASRPRSSFSKRCTSRAATSASRISPHLGLIWQRYCWA